MGMKLYLVPPLTATATHFWHLEEGVTKAPFGDILIFHESSCKLKSLLARYWGAESPIAWNFWLARSACRRRQQNRHAHPQHRRHMLQVTGASSPTIGIVMASHQAFLHFHFQISHVVPSPFLQWQACLGRNFPSYRWVCKDREQLRWHASVSCPHEIVPSRASNIFSIYYISRERPTPILKVDPWIFFLFSLVITRLLNGSFLIMYVDSLVFSCVRLIPLQHLPFILYQNNPKHACLVLDMKKSLCADEFYQHTGCLHAKAPAKL